MCVGNGVERDFTSLSLLLGQWFEVTPHEAGFTELGVFVETSLLGSKFHRGEVTEKKPEMDMVRLQGKLSHPPSLQTKTLVSSRGHHGSLKPMMFLLYDE